MTLVDQLSDTLYREQAVKKLDQLVANNDPFPVQRSQIYGLRQIARQQPGEIVNFADHQSSRAKRKQETASPKKRLELQDEIDFWSLVENLCSNPASDWSVPNEGDGHLPEELRNIPEKREGMTKEEQGSRNQLRNRRKEWLAQWNNTHVPAFFERFCTHALYRQGMAENARKE